MPETTEGAPNPNIPRPFSTLPPDQKARTMLAIAREPISQEMLYHFAGITVDELQEPEKASLNKLFADPSIQKRDNEKSGIQQFWIADEEKKKVLKEIGVDELDAELHLADVLWSDLYGKE